MTLGLALVLFLAPPKDYAASASAAEPGSGGVSPQELGYSVKLWTVEDGLPANYIDWLTQTPDGYLWWPTTWGLARFDGVRFRSFSAQDEQGRDRTIEGVFSDSTGRLWVWNWLDVMAQFKDGQFHTLPKSPGQIQGSGVFESTDGAIWVVKEDGPDEGHLERIDGDVREILPIPSTSIFAIRPHVDSSRRLWAWKNGRLHRSEATGLVPLDLPAPPGKKETSVSFFYKLPDGSTAVVGHYGVYVLRDQEWQLARAFPVPFDAKFTPHGVALDGLGNTWIGTRLTGLWLLTPDDRAVQVNLPGLVFPDGFGMGAVFADKENNLWAGSRNGLYQLQRVLFRSVHLNEHLHRSESADMAQDAAGDLWTVTEAGVVIRNGPGGGSAEVLKGIPQIRHVEADQAGMIWLVGQTNIWRWENGELRDLGQLRPPDSQEADHIYQVFSSGNDCWFLTGNRIWRGNHDGLELLSMPSTFPSRAGVLFHVNQSGTARGRVAGLGLFEVTTNRWNLLPTTDRALQQKVQFLHVDPESRTWTFGANPPLMRFQDGVWSEAPLGPSEMPVEVIAVKSDDKNGLWALTVAHGVFRIDRDFHSDQPGIVQWFGTAAGLPSNAGRGWGKGMMKSRDGRIWVGTARGIAVIDPAEWQLEKDRLGPPQVHIEEVYVNDVLAERQLDGGVVVDPGESRLEIHFTALGLNNATENRFRYQLAGLDRTLRHAGNSRSAVYHNVPPGRHLFRVIAANSFGTWNQEGAALLITVLPAWWQRASVQIAGGVLLVGAVLLFYRIRLRQLERRRAFQENFSRELIRSQEEERRRIALELHDGLGQNLLATKNLALLRTMRPLSTEEHSEHFREISESIGAVIDEMRNISRALRPPELDNLGLTKAIRAALRRVESTSALRVHSEIAEIDGRLGADDEISVYRLIQEALSNVMKHAQAREVRVKVSADDKSIRAEISDDGQGFDPDALRRRGQTGLGLLGMKERVHLMGGHLELRAGVGKGTRLTINIPVKLPTT